MASLYLERVNIESTPILKFIRARKRFYAYHCLLFWMALAIGNGNLMAQTDAAPLDSQLVTLLHQLGDQDTDTARMQVYWKLAGYLLYKNTRESKGYARKALLIARNSGTDQDVAYSFRMLGGALSISGDYLEAVDTLHAALSLIDPLSDTMAINIHNSLGICYQYLYDYDAALDHYGLSIQLSMDNGLERKAIPAQGCIANLYAQRGEYLKAMPHVKWALTLAEQYGQEALQAYFQKDIAHLYVQLHYPDSALIHARKAISLAEKNDLLYISSDAYIKLSNAYRLQGDFQQSIEAANKAAGIARQVQAKSVLIWAEQSAAKTYRELHEYDKSLAHSYEALKISEDAELLDEQVHSLQLLADIHSRNKQYDLAFSYQRKATQIREDQATLERNIYQEIAVKRAQILIEEANTKLIRDQVSKEGLMSENTWLFGGAMLLFSLFAGGLIFFLVLRNPETYEDAITPVLVTAEEMELKLSFVRRLSLFFLVLTFPLFFHYLIWGPFELIWIHLFFSGMLVGAYFEAKKGRLDRILYVVIFAGYFLIAMLPIWAGELHTVAITHIGVFIAVNYISQSRFHRVLNGVFLVIAFLIDFYIIQYVPLEPVGNLEQLEFILGLISLLIIAFSIFSINMSTNGFKKALFKSNQFLQEVSDLNPHFIFAKSKDRKLTFVNDAMARAFGKSKAEMIGLLDADFGPEFSLDPHVPEDDSKVLNSGMAIWRREELIQNNNRTERWLETYKQPLKDKNGEIIGLLGVSTDITDRRNAEVERRKSEKRYRDIFVHSQQAIAVYDFETQQMIDCNPKALEVLRCESLDEISHYTFLDWMAPIQLNGQIASEWITEQVERLLADGRIHYTAIKNRANGERYIAEETILTDFTDSYKHIWRFSTEITEAYHAQQEVKERKTIYQSLIENSFDGIDIIQVSCTNIPEKPFEGKLIVRNEVMTELLERATHPFLIGENILDYDILIGSESSDHKREKIRELLKTLRQNRSVKFEWDLAVTDGEFRRLAIVMHIIKINGKRLLIRFVRDITLETAQQQVIHQQLADLNLKNEQLQQYIESNLNLENFAYLASHDLKSPIRTIVSFAQLLERKLSGKISTEEREYLNFIVSASKNMQKLINALLAYSRVNTTHLFVEPVNIPVMLQHLQNEMSTSIQEKGALIRLENIPEYIDGDEIKLRQLFQNLIANAIKFSVPDRQIDILIEAEQTAAYWRFQVSDNGIGIEEAYRDKIFMLFQRLHSEVEYEGTGIGLALCRKVVEQHGGEIGFSSEHGVGTTFFFTIPLNLSMQGNSKSKHHTQGQLS